MPALFFKIFFLREREIYIYVLESKCIQRSRCHCADWPVLAAKLVRIHSLRILHEECDV